MSMTKNRLVFTLSLVITVQASRSLLATQIVKKCQNVQILRNIQKNYYLLSYLSRTRTLTQVQVIFNVDTSLSVGKR